MVLIADSGSTKTDWSICNTNKPDSFFKTSGINPFFQSREDIIEMLEKELYSHLQIDKIDEVHFYGAGCIAGEPQQQMYSLLKELFPKDTYIEVESDLTGSARALFGKKSGIACILGTGSNSGHYDGEKIIGHVSPLGYILGDEGSGAALGKKLVSDCLKNQLPNDIISSFFQRFQLTPSDILSKVYKGSYPNRFLASLSVFMNENIDRLEIRKLVQDCFVSFFERNIYQYNYTELPVGIIGSIGYYYQEIICQVADEMSISICTIEKSPMEGLIKYHKSN